MSFEFTEHGGDFGDLPHRPDVSELADVYIGAEDTEAGRDGAPVDEEIKTDVIGVDPRLVVDGGAAVPAEHPDDAEDAADTPNLPKVDTSLDVSESLEGPVEATLFPPIETNGAGDAYTEFEEVGTTEVRARVAAAAKELIHTAAPGLDMADVVVSCFGEGYDPTNIDSADQYKLSVPSAVPEGGFVDSHTNLDHDFKGDDSNEANLIERDIQELRGERAHIGREMAMEQDAGTLTDEVRAAGIARTNEINQQIAGLRARKSEQSNTPVYYATPFEGLLDDRAEDNPLGYGGDLPGKTYLAFYNGAAMRAAGIRISEKSGSQLRIHASGRDIMSHCVTVMGVTFTETEGLPEPDEWE